MWEFPKSRGTCFGVPIIRGIVYWDLYWGPPIYGNYHVSNPLNPEPTARSKWRIEGRYKWRSMGSQNLLAGLRV